VLMQYRESDNLLETIIGRLMVEIARGDSLVRQRSMLLSITDNRETLSSRRNRLEMDTANYIAALHNLAQDHGLDPLRDLHGVDLEIVRLAVAPLNRKGGAA